VPRALTRCPLTQRIHLAKFTTAPIFNPKSSGLLKQQNYSTKRKIIFILDAVFDVERRSLVDAYGRPSVKDKPWLVSRWRSTKNMGMPPSAN
jgi:hypothetical protein